MTSGSVLASSEVAVLHAVTAASTVTRTHAKKTFDTFIRITSVGVCETMTVRLRK